MCNGFPPKNNGVEGRAGFRPCSLETIKEDWIVNAIKFALLLVALSTTAMAAESECFCLENKDDHFRHSCEMQQQGTRQVAQCRDDAGNPYKIDDLTGWTRIAAGQGRCTPCRQTINPRGGDIRGDSAKDAPK